jgi:heme-degrading monooxygenase HmoA
MGATDMGATDMGRQDVFIAMNRFRIARGRESEFEEIWRNRDSHLEGVAGFQAFRLLRGPEDDEATLYASHTVWDSRSAFEEWTRSEAFRAAHAGAGASSGVYLGHPQFEGFEDVI